MSSSELKFAVPLPLFFRSRSDNKSEAIRGFIKGNDGKEPAIFVDKSWKGGKLICTILSPTTTESHAFYKLQLDEWEISEHDIKAAKLILRGLKVSPIIGVTELAKKEKGRLVLKFALHFGNDVAGPTYTSNTLYDKTYPEGQKPEIRDHLPKKIFVQDNQKIWIDCANKKVCENTSAVVIFNGKKYETQSKVIGSIVKVNLPAIPSWPLESEVKLRLRLIVNNDENLVSDDIDVLYMPCSCKHQYASGDIKEDDASGKRETYDQNQDMVTPEPKPFFIDPKVFGGCHKNEQINKPSTVLQRNQSGENLSLQRIDQNQQPLSQIANPKINYSEEPATSKKAVTTSCFGNNPTSLNSPCLPQAEHSLSGNDSNIVTTLQPTGPSGVQHFPRNIAASTNYHNDTSNDDSMGMSSGPHQNSVVTQTPSRFPQPNQNTVSSGPIKSRKRSYGNDQGNGEFTKTSKIHNLNVDEGMQNSQMSNSYVYKGPWPNDFSLPSDKDVDNLDIRSFWQEAKNI